MGRRIEVSCVDCYKKFEMRLNDYSRYHKDPSTVRCKSCHRKRKVTAVCGKCGVSAEITHGYLIESSKNNIWTCGKCRDKKIVPVSCVDCGIEFNVSYRCHRENPKHLWKCRPCINRMKKDIECTECHDIFKIRYDIYDRSVTSGKWKCNQCKSQEKIEITCTECGATVKVLLRTFRFKENDRDKVWRCRKCNDEYRKLIFNNKSPEEYQEWNRKRVEGFNNYLNNLNITPNKTEAMFIHALNLHGINYMYIWYNVNKHEKFNELFPYNYNLGTNKVSPHHAWDFKINLYDRSILVDVDGSIHDSSNSNYEVTYHDGTTFLLSDYIEWKDSQRPYQCDDYDAYAILAYNNIITPDTPVLDIRTDNLMTFKRFMDLLWLMTFNLTEKERRKLIKNGYHELSHISHSSQIQ